MMQMLRDLYAGNEEALAEIGEGNLSVADWLKAYSGITFSNGNIH